jgi:hypothetical protein
MVYVDYARVDLLLYGRRRWSFALGIDNLSSAALQKTYSKPKEDLDHLT